MTSFPDLEDRIQRLEAILISSSPSKSSSKPLIDQLEFVEKAFKENNVQPQIAFLQKFKEFMLMMDRFDKDTTYYLSNRDKLKLMLSSSNMIENILTDLRDLKALKKYLDFDPFLEVKQKNETIADLIQELRVQSKDFEIQNNGTMEFLTTNENVITQINQKLLYLESLISILEKEKAKTKKKI